MEKLDDHMATLGLRTLVPSALVALTVAGCFGIRPPNDDIPPRPTPAIFPSLPQTPSLQVLVLGDWGTGGRHEVGESLEEYLLPLLQGRADLYLAGHNHSVELLELPGGVLHAVCGAGGGLDNPYRVEVTAATLSAFTNGGWCLLKIWPELLAVELYDRGGGLQYRHLVRKEGGGG
jgi:hypothetical protein